MYLGSKLANSNFAILTRCPLSWFSPEVDLTRTVYRAPVTHNAEPQADRQTNADPAWIKHINFLGELGLTAGSIQRLGVIK